jgi:hypothetical protein
MRSLYFDPSAGNTVSNTTELNFPSGFNLKLDGQRVVLGIQQGTVDDATENITSVKTQLNLLLTACRNFGLIDLNESSSSSSSSSSYSSSSSSVMGCCDTYDFEGATSDVLSNGVYSYQGVYNSRPYWFNGSRYLFYKADDKWGINTTLSEISVKYYSDGTFLLCPEGQYRFSNDSLQGYMHCGNASSTSSSSESSSSSSSFSSSSSSTESSSSSIMGCPISVSGSGFTTFSEANGTFNFAGYYGGRPQYRHAVSLWYVQYETMDSRWSIATDLGVLKYYSAASPMTDCPPYWDYKLISSGVSEGSIT